MNEPTPHAGKPNDWARRIEARYRCQLSDDLAEWFDKEFWREADGSTTNTFDSAIAPQELLAETPGAVWPALMPSDFLPILGNQMGDWLCVRFAPDNSARQIVHWYHGGGDWIPWGDCLAEAIVFDHLRKSLPGSDRDHAVSASASRTSAGGPENRLLDWAAGSIDSGLTRDKIQVSGMELADAMLAAGLCEPAVRCQLVIDALDNPLLGEDLIASLKIDPDEPIKKWLFDNHLMDSTLLNEIARRVQTSPEELLDQQSWQSVEMHCRAVTEIAPELAWAWDLAGYSLERVGDREGAVPLYRRGMDCSIFTDQTVRVRTHEFNRDGKKFSAVRLTELGYQSASAAEREYLRRLNLPSIEDRRRAIQEYFAELAEQREIDGADEESHRFWVRAAWDLGAEPMIVFGTLLDNIARTAAAAGRDAQCELARTHRECFRDRYGT